MELRKTLVIAILAASAGAGCVAALGQTSARVVHGGIADLQWQALPEFGGEEAIIYRSADGTRVAAAFRESGAHSFTYPFDEFVVVTRGSAQVRIHGGPSFVLNAGDYAYFEEGATVDFVFSQDFEDLTMLMSDQQVRWR